MDQGRPDVSQAPCVVHHRTDEWFTFLLNHGRSERTKWTYENCLRWFGEHLASYGIRWEDVTSTGPVEQWISDMRTAGRHPKSILSRVGAVRGFFSWLAAHGHIDRDPLAKLAPIRVPKSLPRVYNPQEVELMRAGAKTLREKVVIEVFYACGVRRQGLLDIKLQDTDLRGRTIRIHHKGGKERIVIITPSAVLAILRWLPQRAMIASKFEKDEGWLFIGREGQLHGQRILDIVHKVAERAGVDRAHCHAWRHTYGTRMHDGGASLKTIKTLMGHESISTTEKYVHLSMERLKEEYDRAHPGNLTPPASSSDSPTPHRRSAMLSDASKKFLDQMFKGKPVKVREFQCTQHKERVLVIQFQPGEPSVIDGCECAFEAMNAQAEREDKWETYPQNASTAGP